MGYRERAKEFLDAPPVVGKRAPGISSSGESGSGRSINRRGDDRRLVSYKLPEGILTELERVAKKRGVTMTLVVEEALAEKLDAVCESCGR